MNLDVRKKALAEFDAWTLARAKEGWPSVDIQVAAIRLRGALWEAANNEQHHATLPEALVKLTAEFEAAKARAGS